MIWSIYFFNCLNALNLKNKMITRLWLGLIRFKFEIKSSNIVFKTVSSLSCRCGIEVETITYYLLHCSNYLLQRKTLLGNTKSVLIFWNISVLLFLIFSLWCYLSWWFNTTIRQYDNQLYNIYKKIWYIYIYIYFKLT